MAEQLSKVLKTRCNIAADNCENCGNRRKAVHRGETRGWCKRCIEVYYRKEGRSSSRSEKEIVRRVGELYVDATIETLAPGLKDRFLALPHGKDVYLHGPIGTGKTHAMAALLRHYVYEGYDCERINFDDFTVLVRSTMSPASKTTQWDLCEPLKDVDKLFIDDIGLHSKPESDFVYTMLYSILNKRQERRLPTYFSSNKTIEKLAESFDGRIASRLSTAEIIELSGKDRRLTI